MGYETDSSHRSSVLGNVASAVRSTLRSNLDYVIPPARRADVQYRVNVFCRNRPLLASLLICQILCSGIPLALLILQIVSVLFFSFATAIVIGSICALLFTAVCVGLALLVLVPILMVTTFLGLTVWVWAWVGWYILTRMGFLERRRALAKSMPDKENQNDRKSGMAKNGS